MRYAFIDAHRQRHPVRALCKILGVHPSGFYAWIKEPLSRRAIEDERQTSLARQAWNESGKIYGYRKIHDDLIEMGEAVSENRVARLTRLAGIQAQIGYKKKPGQYGGKPSVAIDNTLNRQFAVEAPDRAWVTDITYLRTRRGFLYLVAIMDWHTRKVLAWRISNTLEAIRSLKRYIAREVFGIIMRRQKQINQSQIAT